MMKCLLWAAVAIAAVGAATGGAGAPAGTQPADRATPSAVMDLIRIQGETPPDWWDTVVPNYPPTLDLTWSGPVQPWNHNKNMGQFIWDVINPNPDRWREGIKLLHTCLNANKANRDGLIKTISALANMYQNLLQDWARAAYWWQALSRFRPLYTDETVRLAECYWKLGSRQLAVRTVSGMNADLTGRALLIQLWSDMGDVDRALQLAQERVAAGVPDSAYLAAGDACRRYGRYADAVAFYQKVLALPQDKRTEQFHKRASANLQAVRLFDELDLGRIPDGTYSASSLGYNGTIRLEVTVKGTRIGGIRILQHNEKQFYSAFTDTVDQIVKTQDVRNVDATTGATWTSEAVINAAATALSGAMKQPTGGRNDEAEPVPAAAEGR